MSDRLTSPARYRRQATGVTVTPFMATLARPIRVYAIVVFTVIASAARHVAGGLLVWLAPPPDAVASGPALECSSPPLAG